MFKISRTVIGVFFCSQLLLGCASNSESTTTHKVDAGDVESVSGTVVMKHTQVMLLVGGGWGGGMLQFNGNSYPFKSSGLRLGGLGVQKVDIKGNVYSLSDVKDFSGVYYGAQAGLTVAKGKAGAWLKNDKGVTLHLTTTDAEGLALSIGAGGVKFTME